MERERARRAEPPQRRGTQTGRARKAPAAAPLVLAVLAALVFAGCASPPPAANTTSPPATPSTTPAAAGNGSAGGGAGGTVAAGADPVVVMNTSMGDIRIQLYLHEVPATAGNFLNLSKAGFFDGQRFHRVIANFMDQAGDPLSKDASKQDQWGTGGPPCNLAPQYPCDSRGYYSIPDEFYCNDGTVSSTWTGAGGDPCADHQGMKWRFDNPGVLAMANTGQPHSGGSQFFITDVPYPSLDGGYPIFGHVVGGQDVVDQINHVPTDSNDRPIHDVFINHVTVAS